MVISFFPLTVKQSCSLPKSASNLDICKIAILVMAIWKPKSRKNATLVWQPQPYSFGKLNTSNLEWWFTSWDILNPSSQSTAPFQTTKSFNTLFASKQCAKVNVPVTKHYLTYRPQREFLRLLPSKPLPHCHNSSKVSLLPSSSSKRKTPTPFQLDNIYTQTPTFIIFPFFSLTHARQLRKNDRDHRLHRTKLIEKTSVPCGRLVRTGAIPPIPGTYFQFTEYLVVLENGAWLFVHVCPNNHTFTEAPTRRARLPKYVLAGQAHSNVHNGVNLKANRSCSVTRSSRKMVKW